MRGRMRAVFSLPSRGRVGNRRTGPMAVLFVAMLLSIMLVGRSESTQPARAPADDTLVAAAHHGGAAPADGLAGDSRLVTSNVLAQHLAHLDAADLVVTDDQRETAA